MYILCVTSHVSVYCLLFLVVYILLEARNNPYNIVFPRNWIRVQTCFGLSNCRAYPPLHVVIRCAKSKRSDIR